LLLYPIFANLKNNKMAIPDKYNPQETEQKWYSYWLENKFFHSEPNDKPPYTIVIPPPNVTGILHMGHMLNNTIQDVLVRRARMKGFNACWVPGTDHASIATEAKVVAKLKEQGVSKSDITREEFLKHAWDWTNQYGGTILEQLKKLGCSCDWDRTRFTLEDKLSQQVIKSFVDLYNKGLIYRGYRMVNWDPEAKTNISDEEVIFKEQNGKLYFLKYQIEGSEEFLTVATTRPETIFGDVAICINPNDERYAHLKGKKAIVPIVNRAVPIIEDDYVDIEFGTGALKITPAHDVNDYEIGQKHSLPMLDILDDDANLNEHGLHYAGKNRFEVRKAIAKELEEKNLLLKAEDYVNKVGTSERTGAVIEPKISQQWFLKMSEIAKPALDVVMNDEIKFHPEKFKNTYKHWMENIRDWNISRQLWWGQRIPAYYYGDGENDFVVAENIDEALKLAKAKNPNLKNGKAILFTCQNKKSLDELEREGRFTNKRRYINEHLEDEAPMILKVYDWFVDAASKRVKKPEDVEYQVWCAVSASACMKPEKNEVVYILEVPDEEVIYFSSLKWDYILNYHYVPENEKDLERYTKEIEAKGFANTYEFLVGRYAGKYPTEEWEIRESWSRVFDIPKWNPLEVQANLWEIKKEWVKKILRPGEPMPDEYYER